MKEKFICSLAKNMKTLALTFVMLVFSVFVWAQKTVTGKVTDSKDGSPLVGVTIQAKGTKVSTQTSTDGTFKINVPAGATALSVTSVGFEKKELPINDGSMAVQLVQTNSQLNEVVVVGYGTQRKKDVTASISKIGADKIANVAAPSFESALAGKAAGVNVSTSGGLAGSSAIIRIRGVNSISIPGDPLYVIDGLPIDVTYLGGSTRNSLAQDRNPLSNLNPNDIESIEILKDAGAAGIYGSRGANGVVLITTKRGKGKLKHSFSSRIGISGPTVKPKYVDKDTWLAIRQEAWELDGNTGVQQGLPGAQGGFSLSKALSNPGTDWWDLATRTGFSQEYNYSISKGTEKLSYYVGGVYGKENSYVFGNDFQRAGARANIDYRPIRKLSLGVNLSYNHGLNNMLNNAWNGGLGLAMSTGLPYYPVFNDDGTFFRTDGYKNTWGSEGGNNLVAQRENTKYTNRENRYITAFNAKYTLIKNLDLAGNYSYEKNKSLFNSYKTAWILNRPNPDARQGNAVNDLNTYTNKSYNFTANYIWEPNSRNRVTLLLGTEYQDQQTVQKYSYLDSASGPVNKKTNQTSFTDSVFNATKPSTTFARKFRSVFARVNYNLLGRYVLQGSLRRDESSVFRENNQVAWFPTVSGAWTVSQESFMKGIKWLDNLKLRASWGLVGTSNIPWNAGYPSFDTSRVAGGYYNGSPTIYRTILGNKDLKWETSSNIDLALEVGILRNRVNFEFGYYRKKSTDVLLEVPVSIFNGIGDKQWVNKGSILNRGLEFNLNTVNVLTKDFTWTTNFNIAYNYNEVLGIDDLNPDAIAGGTNETRIVPGYPVGTIFTVRFYGVDPADGMPIYLDAAGKQTKTLVAPDGALGDRVPVANTLPYYSGGLTNNFKYKNWELNTVFTYQQGGHVWDNSGKRSIGWMSDWNVYSMYVGNYWRKPGDVAKYPRPTIAGYPQTNSPGDPWRYNSSIQVFSSDYIRLREVSLNYNIPQSILSKWKISSAKVFVSGFNVLLFTKYPVGDPETGRDGEDNGARNQSGNANFLNAPLQRSFNFGVNISF